MSIYFMLETENCVINAGFLPCNFIIVVIIIIISILNGLAQWLSLKVCANTHDKF
jgi:hypothetical protein